MSLAGGIDLGGTKIQAAVVADGGDVLGDARRPTPTGSPQELVADLSDVMREALANANTDATGLSGVGVGWPGIVDEDTGTVTVGVNLSGWEGTFPLADALSAALGSPVSVRNDVQAATDAEFAYGAGRDYRSLLGVFWGTGVGGGLVLDGKPWVGHGASGEIGHMVVRENGRRCPCGRRGCMEAYAGRHAMELRARRLVDRGRRTMLFDLMEEKGRERLTSGIWERAVREEDPLATRLIDRAVRAIATAIASALNLLDIEAVVIGGGMGERLAPLYMDRLEAEVMKHLFHDTRPPDIRVAELADFGGAVGASLLALQAR